MNLRWAVCATLAVTGIFGADAGLMSMVMPEARVVAGIDVTRAKASTFGQFLMANMGEQKSELEKLATMTGFDPRRDLQEIVFASTDSKGRKSKGLVLARGTFDSGRLMAAMRDHGLTSQSINGVDFFQKKGENGAFAFPTAGVAVLGDFEQVRSALSQQGAASPLPPALFNKVQSLSQNNEIWLVSTVPVAEMAEKVPNGAPGGEKMSGMMKGDAFRGIEQAAMGLQLGANLLNVTLEAAARSEVDAAAMADVVRFLASMLQLNRNGGEMSGLASALDTMKLTTEAKNLKVTVTIPQAEVEKMILKERAKTVRKV